MSQKLQWVLWTLLVLGTFCASAQTVYYWRGAAPTGNWSDNRNWWFGFFLNGQAYGIQQFGGTGQSVANNDNGGSTLNTHAFDFANLFGSQAFTITGDPIRFSRFRNNDPYIQNRTVFTQTINANIEGDGRPNTPLQIRPISGDLVFGGTVNNRRSSIEITGGGNNVTFHHTVSGQGGLEIEDGATVTFTGDAGSATFTGDTIIKHGTLVISDRAADPFDSDIILGDTSGSDPANLTLGNNGGIVTLDTDIEIRATGGNKTITSIGTDGNIMSGDLTLNGNLTIQTDTALDISGQLNGSSTLFKEGTDLLSLSGNSAASYNGDIEIDAGTIQITAAGNVAGSTTHIRDTGTLAGEGTAGDIIVHDGGTLSPGGVNNGPGTLSTSNGDVTFAGGGSYLFEIKDFSGGLVNPNTLAGTDWDLINIDGTLNISSTTANPFNIDISTIVSPTWAEGNTGTFDYTKDYLFTIASANAITGFNASKFALNFSGFKDYNPYAQNWEVIVSGGNLQLRYNSGTVLIPEPSSMALLGFGLFVIIRTQRKPHW